MAEFADKVVVVTGAAGGTGAVIAEGFAREGAAVAVSDLDGEGASRHAADLATRFGVPTVGVATDVAQPAACHDLIDRTVAGLGGLDVLVNCAGIFTRVPALEMEAEVWDRMFAVNLHGAFHCSQAAARHWVAAGKPGAIVNISSTASTHSAAGLAAYSATKAGLSSLTRSLGVEWARHRIRVNGVAPAHINVERLREVGERGLIDLESVARSIPMGRLAEPSEVADAVMYLAGDKASFVTSQVLFVDGGFGVPPIYRYETV